MIINRYKVAQCPHSNANKRLQARLVSLHQQFLKAHLCKLLSQLLPSAYHHQCDEVCNSDLAVRRIMRLSSVYSKDACHGLNHLLRSRRQKAPQRN